MDEAMKMMTQPRTDTRQRCLTKSDIAKGLLQTETDNQGCKSAVTVNTKTAFDMTRTCTGKRTENSAIHMEALSPEAMRGTIASTTSQGGSTQKLNISMTGRWVSASCGAVK